MGSGINTTFRQVGIATGVAGLGAIFQSRVDSKLAELLPNAPRGLGEIVSSGGSQAAAARARRRGLAPKSSHAADVAFVSGFNEILLIAAVLSFVGAALGFFPGPLQRLRPAQARDEPQQSPSAASLPDWSARVGGALAASARASTPLRVSEARRQGRSVRC